MDSRVDIRINEDEKERLQELSEKYGMSSSELIRNLLNSLYEEKIALDGGNSPYEKELNNLIAACADKKQDVRTVLTNTTNSVWQHNYA